MDSPLTILGRKHLSSWTGATISRLLDLRIYRLSQTQPDSARLSSEAFHLPLSTTCRHWKAVGPIGGRSCAAATGIFLCIHRDPCAPQLHKMWNICGILQADWPEDGPTVFAPAFCPPEPLTYIDILASSIDIGINNMCVYGHIRTYMDMYGHILTTLHSVHSKMTTAYNHRNLCRPGDAVEIHAAAELPSTQ